MQGWTRGLSLATTLGLLSLSAVAGYALTHGRTTHIWFEVAFVALAGAFLVTLAVVRRRISPTAWHDGPSPVLLVSLAFIGVLSEVQAVINRDSRPLQILQGVVGVLLLGHVVRHAVPAWATRRRDRDEISR